MAIIPAAVFLATASSPAFAQDPPNYKCQDNNDPNNLLDVIPTQTTEQNPEQGFIIVDEAGDCTIPHDLFATGKIQIRAGGKVTITGQTFRSMDSQIEIRTITNGIDAQNTDFLAATHIDLEAGAIVGSGELKARDIISNTDDMESGNGNILLRSQLNLIVRDIKTNGFNGENSLRSGAVQIDPNLSVESSTFEIGGANIREIDLRSVNGGGNQDFTVESGIRITNGTTNSVGNITVSDLNAIKVKNTSSRAGIIHLNANKGTITLAPGVLDASGTNDSGGGQIYLLADLIKVNGDTTITTKQTNSADGNARQILLAASKIDYRASGKLEILSDGNGGPSGPTRAATIYFLPQGGIITQSMGSVEALHWTQEFNGAFFSYPGQLEFDGGTSADLEVRADGDNVQIAITGYPIRFIGKDVTVQAKGDHNQGKHEIVMGYFDFANYSGINGIDFQTIGKVDFNVRGQGSNGAGGDIQIQSDRIVLKGDPITFKANGPQGKNGDGGTIFYTATDTIIDPNTKVKFIADASKDGIGNAQLLRNNRKAIYFQAANTQNSPETTPIGIAKGQVNFSATGGGSGGNAGSIQLDSSGNFRVRNKPSVIDASAALLASAGDGGEVIINAKKTVFVQNAEDPVGSFTETAINAEGASITGKGGTVVISKAEAKQPNSGPKFLNVNVLIRIDSGLQEPLPSYHGRIQLNGVNCIKARTGVSPWPESVWGCDGAVGAARIFAAGNSLNADLKNRLSTDLVATGSQNTKVELYGMIDQESFNKFFDINETGENLGFTWIPARASAIFDGANEGAGLHEIGHQLDNIWGWYSTTLLFDDAYNADIAAFNALPCQSAFPPAWQSVCAGQGDNFTKFTSLGFDFNKQEAFAYMFEHANPQFIFLPELDFVLAKMTHMKFFQEFNIQNPPAAVQ